MIILHEVCRKNTQRHFTTAHWANIFVKMIGNKTLFGKEVTIAIQGSLTGVPKEEIVRSVELLLDLDLGRRREYQVRELFSDTSYKSDSYTNIYILSIFLLTARLMIRHN